MIKRKTIFPIFSGLALIILMTSCTKTKITESKPQKTKLELSFGSDLEKIDLSYLENCLGTNSGNEESFGEQKSMLVFFSEEDCSTCKTVRPVIQKWISESGIKVYEYQENPKIAEAENQKMLKKLGSPDGFNITAARLIAFENGKRIASIAGSYDLENTEKIDNFVKRFFELPEKKSIKAKELKKLNGINELRTAVQNNEEFILYFERYSCPDCRKLSNPNGQNIITTLAQNYEGSIYKIITENTIAQLSEPVTVDGINYTSSFDYFSTTGTDPILFAESDNLKKKAEYLEMLVALKEIEPCADSTEEFLKEISAFALNRRNKFQSSDRNVPSFAAVSNNQNYDFEKVQAILKTAYTESQMLKEGENLHRIQFDHYFSPDNNVISTELYQQLLIQYANFW